MKFRAKPEAGIFKEIEVGELDWLYDLLDKDGFVTGYYVDGYIVGDIVEAEEEYLSFEFHIPIQKETLEAVE